MADCAIFILWNAETGQALMEDRPDLWPGAEHYWVYPGGKVEESESASQAMVRECIEEVGVTPLDFDPLPGQDQVSLLSRPRPGTKQYGKAPEGWLVVPFLVTAWQGTPASQSLDNNHAPMRWADPIEIAGEDLNEYTCNVQIARLLVAMRYGVTI